VTQPAPETLANERDKLFVTDAELIRRLGLPEKIGRAAIQELDRSQAGRPRFPRKEPLFGNRRYWPAIEKYFMLSYGVNDAASQQKEQHYATDEAGEAGESGDARSRVETPQETLVRVLGAATGHRSIRLSHRKPTFVAAIGSTDGDPD
jgi:hypothetical protein